MLRRPLGAAARPPARDRGGARQALLAARHARVQPARRRQGAHRVERDGGLDPRRGGRGHRRGTAGPGGRARSPRCSSAGSRRPDGRWLRSLQGGRRPPPRPGGRLRLAARRLHPPRRADRPGACGPTGPPRRPRDLLDLFGDRRRGRPLFTTGDDADRADRAAPATSRTARSPRANAVAAGGAGSRLGRAHRRRRASPRWRRRIVRDGRPAPRGQPDRVRRHRGRAWSLARGPGRDRRGRRPARPARRSSGRAGCPTRCSPGASRPARRCGRAGAPGAAYVCRHYVVPAPGDRPGYARSDSWSARELTRRCGRGSERPTMQPRSRAHRTGGATRSGGSCPRATAPGRADLSGGAQLSLLVLACTRGGHHRHRPRLGRARPAAGALAGRPRPRPRRLRRRRGDPGRRPRDRRPGPARGGHRGRAPPPRGHAAAAQGPPAAPGARRRSPDGPLLGFPGASAPYWEFRGQRPVGGAHRADPRAPAHPPGPTRARPGCASVGTATTSGCRSRTAEATRALDAARRDRLLGQGPRHRARLPAPLPAGHAHPAARRPLLQGLHGGAAPGLSRAGPAQRPSRPAARSSAIAQPKATRRSPRPTLTGCEQRRRAPLGQLDLGDAKSRPPTSDPSPLDTKVRSSRPVLGRRSAWPGAGPRPAPRRSAGGRGGARRRSARRRPGSRRAESRLGPEQDVLVGEGEQGPAVLVGHHRLQGGLGLGGRGRSWPARPGATACRRSARGCRRSSPGAWCPRGPG